jgi:hypothetical protein
MKMSGTAHAVLGTFANGVFQDTYADQKSACLNQCLLVRVTVCSALPGGVDADVPLFTINNKTVGIDVRDLPFSRCSIFKHSKGLAVLSGWSQRSQPTLHHKTV